MSQGTVPIFVAATKMGLSPSAHRSTQKVEQTRNQHTIILGVIGSDCHSVGNKILDAYFCQQGYRVVNLGVMVSQDEFIAAALEQGADAILVSSLYGHGEIDCDGFRRHCTERGLGDILLYLGGNLVVGKASHEAVLKKFAGQGFDGVFTAADDLDAVAARLKADLERRGATAGLSSSADLPPDTTLLDKPAVAPARPSPCPLPEGEGNSR